ncbi:unnamed protein product, partial [Symbiodinium pilosum]
SAKPANHTNSMNGTKHEEHEEHEEPEYVDATVAEIDPEGELVAMETDVSCASAEKSGRGWWVGGDKMWGSGRGIENVHGNNLGYYNQGMDAAHSRCGGSSCALIVNPPGHRSINQFHIHFFHYAGYGANLKGRLEKRVCGRSGWKSGGFPCHGKAMYVSGWPRVFSVALGGGGMHHASVIAWPGACGRRGTIIQLAYGCSIEHQIRGDYDPSKR